MRIVLIAPTLALRAGLRTLLGSAPGEDEPGEALDVVLEASTLEEMDALAEDVDVLLLVGEDIPSPALRSALPGEIGRMALLLLSDNPQGIAGLSRLPLRAWGVLPLDCTAEELHAALRALHQGLLVGAPSLVEPAFSSLLSLDDSLEGTAAPLTDREGQVLGMLAHGLANKQIAAELGISEHTVKFHVSSIYTKMGAANRAEAVRLGVQRGLIIL